MSFQFSDEELMSQIKTGKIEAFEVLLDRHRKPLFSFIFRMLGDFHRSQDIFQETFLRVFRHAHRYNESFKFSTWLYSIARNLCLGEIRKQKKLEMISINSETKSPLVEHHNEKTPDKELESKELEQIVERAILHLTEKQREVFLLREIQRFSYEEIAQITNMSVPAVKSCLHRARLALMEMLIPYIKPKSSAD